MPFAYNLALMLDDNPLSGAVVMNQVGSVKLTLCLPGFTIKKER